MNKLLERKLEGICSFVVRSCYYNHMYVFLSVWQRKKPVTLIQRHKPQLQLQRRFCVTDKAGVRPIGGRL